MTTGVWGGPGTPARAAFCVSGVWGPSHATRRAGLGLRHGEVPIGGGPASPPPGVRAAGSVPCPPTSHARSTLRASTTGVSVLCAEPGVWAGPAKGK